MKLDLQAQKDLINKINKESKEYSYQPLDWDVGTIYNRFKAEVEDEEENGGDENWHEYMEDDVSKDIYVPTYQRNLTWDNKKKSKFIESLFLNLPIPFIFLNKTKLEDEEGYESLLFEIIDGSQRIRTIFEFKSGNFKIAGLKELVELNGLKYKDLPIYLQRKFLSMPLRVVVFEGLDIEKRKEMFNRINTSGDPLTSMEVRRGTYEGRFYTLLSTLSKSVIFNELMPLSTKKKCRDEGSELLLRFFAYTEGFNEYDGKVENFLNSYMKKKADHLSLEKIKEEIMDKSLSIEEIDERANSILEERTLELQNLFENTMQFVKKNFPNGFKKTSDIKFASSRVYFESIAVGVGLALRESDSDKLITKNIDKLINSETYEQILTSDGANTKSKFANRINIVREYLLTGTYDRFKAGNIG